jgi:hypothetical protein
MNNKYLTKVALFGFFKKKSEPTNAQTNEEFTKAGHRIHKFMVDSSNLYATHFNKHIDSINKECDEKGIVELDKYHQAIAARVHSPELKKDHKTLHNEYKSDMEKLHNAVADHEYAYSDFIYRHSNWMR